MLTEFKTSVIFYTIKACVMEYGFEKCEKMIQLIKETDRRKSYQDIYKKILKGRIKESDLKF